MNWVFAIVFVAYPFILAAAAIVLFRNPPTK